MDTRCVVGLLFAGIGAHASRRQFQLRRKGQRVTGTVTGLDRQWIAGGPRDPGGYSYSAVLSFQTVAGQHIETKSAVGGSSPGVQVGQSVQVIYNPANPSFAELGNFGAQAAALLVPLTGGIVGVGLAVAGIVTMIGR